MLTIRPTNEVWEGALQESSVYRQPKLNTVPKAKYKNWVQKNSFSPKQGQKKELKLSYFLSPLLLHIHLLHAVC